MFPDYYSDRFIPMRPGPFAAEQLKLPVASSSSYSQTPQQALYTSRVYTACTGRDAPPSSLLTYQRSHEPVRRTSQQYMHDLAKSDEENRILAQGQVPRKFTLERILDARDITDNFYSKVMDVATNNMLVIALDTKVYTSHDSVVKEIDDKMDADSSVTCVHCLGTDTIVVCRGSGSFTTVDPIHEQVKLAWNAARRHFESAASNEPNIGYFGTSAGQIMQIDTRAGRAQQIGSHFGHVPGLSLHSNGQALASGGNDDLIKIWDLRATQALHQLPIHKAAVRALSWTPFNSKLLLSGGGSQDPTICLTSFKQGMPEVVAKVDTESQVTQIVLPQEATRREFVSSHGFANNSCLLWRIPKEETALTPIASTTAEGRILNIATPPDGTKLYAASADETLRVYNGVFVPTQKKPILPEFAQIR